MKKQIIIISQILILVVVLVLIFIIQYGIVTKKWDPLIFETFSNILLAIASGLSVGIFFEIFVRQSQRDETLEIAKLKKELELAGIDSYGIEFKDLLFEIRSKLKTAHTIDMYLTYGGTLFNQLSADLLTAFKRKNVDINIFIIHEDNPFVESYADLWSQIDKSYDLEGLKRRINESCALLHRLAVSAYSDKIHSNLKLYKLLKNPINFSFYRFDDSIIFCPTKLTERKEYRALAIVCKNSNKNDIYNWIIDELDHIKSKSEFLEEIFPKENGTKN